MGINAVLFEGSGIKVGNILLHNGERVQLLDLAMTSNGLRSPSTIGLFLYKVDKTQIFFYTPVNQQKSEIENLLTATSPYSARNSNPFLVIILSPKLTFIAMMDHEQVAFPIRVPRHLLTLLP